MHDILNYTKDDKMKRLLFRRLLAYIVDIAFISIVAGFLSFALMPKSKYNEYAKANQEYQQKYVEYLTNSEEYNIDDLIEMSYRIEQNSFTINITNIVCIIAYFGILQYIWGYTIGKKLFKLKVVGLKKKGLSIYQYFIRTIFNNRLLSASILIVLLKTISQSNFIYCTNIINKVSSLFTIVSIGFILFNKKNRGLHDLISGTKVIYEKGESDG